MRIENFSLLVTNPTAAGQAVQKGAGERHDHSSGLPNDAVQLSRLAQALSDHSERSLHVEQLRKQVAAGSYRPPASAVSKSIVAFHLGK